MSQKYADDYTPREFVASMMFDSLFCSLSLNTYAPSDTPSYRLRVRRQMIKQLLAIAEQYKFDCVLPDIPA